MAVHIDRFGCRLFRCRLILSLSAHSILNDLFEVIIRCGIWRNVLILGYGVGLKLCHIGQRGLFLIDMHRLGSRRHFFLFLCLFFLVLGDKFCKIYPAALAFGRLFLLNGCRFFTELNGLFWLLLNRLSLLLFTSYDPFSPVIGDCFVAHHKGSCDEPEKLRQSKVCQQQHEQKSRQYDYYRSADLLKSRQQRPAQHSAGKSAATESHTVIIKTFELLEKAAAFHRADLQYLHDTAGKQHKHAAFDALGDHSIFLGI